MSVVAVLVAGAVLSGCGTSAQPTMMGRSTPFGSTPGSIAGSMPHGYHASGLTCSAPSSLPGSTVFVMLGDHGMMRMMSGVAPMGALMMLRATPSTVLAGKVSFVVANMGWRTHELVVLPLASGQAAGQRAPGSDGKIDEAGSLGEASSSCASGSGEGIDSGTVGRVTLDLAPGRYELVCNLRNHYANGMRQAFTVS